MAIKVTEQQYNDIIENGLRVTEVDKSSLKYLDRLHLGQFIIHSVYRIPKDEATIEKESTRRTKSRISAYARPSLSKRYIASLKPDGAENGFLPPFKHYVGDIKCFKNYDDMVWCSEPSKYLRIIGTSPKKMQYRCVLNFKGVFYNPEDIEVMRRNLENIENAIGGWEKGEAHITKTALEFQNHKYVMPNTVTMDFKDELGMIAATTFLEDRNKYSFKMFEYQKW